MASQGHSLLAHAFIILLVEVATCHAAATTPHAYWDSMLPKTPMPSALLDTTEIQKADLKKAFKIKQDKNFRLMGVSFVGSYKRNYDVAAQSTSTGDVALNAFDIFTEKDFQPGRKLNLHLYSNPVGGGFLPRKAANSIPFSSDKLPELLRRFSVEPNTQEAKTMKETIESCELKGLVGEKILCSATLESMVEFATSTLGTNDVRATSTTVKKARPSSSLMQKYTISSNGVNEVEASRSLVCHPMTYPYTIFYCHMITPTKTYMLSLVGSDGTEVNAMAVCHMDTSAWNPKHLSFQVLHVKPGTVPVCHVLPPDTVVWTPKN